ncbi:hypothetical protein M8J76_014222 [Diaphorina citri]|nr:hypothetical protein M8J76_014222 [Diaphorina citri]
MAYLINEKTNSIDETKNRNKELINNNNIINDKEEIIKVEGSKKEKKEEEDEESKSKRTANKCDDYYHKQYTRTNNNVQSSKCDIKQYDKNVNKESRHDEAVRLDKCDKLDEVFNKETNFRKDEKNEYCEQFSESTSGTNNRTSKDTDDPVSNQSHSYSNQISKDHVSIGEQNKNGQHQSCNMTTDSKTLSSQNSCSFTVGSRSNNSTNSSSLSQTHKSLSTSNSYSLSPKITRIDKTTSFSQSEKSSRSNSERSFKYETSPAREIRRHSRESSVASSGSRNSLNCDRKVSYASKHDRDISMNDLSEELVEKWIVNNASSKFIDKLVTLSQKERSKQEIREDKQNLTCDYKSKGSGQRYEDGFSSLDSVSHHESSSNVSNSIESVSSYNDPISSCMDLTIRNSASTCNKRTSVTSDLFNLWISNSPIKRCKSPNSRPRASGEWKQQLNLLDEGDLFMELIKDISNELDIDVLCHKILVNVGLLTRADRGSLFLAKGSADNRYLVAKLFDVTVDTGEISTSPW